MDVHQLAGTIPFERIHLKAVIQGLKDYLDGRSAILVGHSFGGLTVSQAAQTLGAQIRGCLFVNAMIPTHRQSMLTLNEQLQQHPIYQQVIFNPKNGRASLPKNKTLAKLMYQKASEGIREQAMLNLRDEPLRLLNSKAMLGESFDRCPKFFIHSKHDPIIPFDVQRRWAALWPKAPYQVIDGDHCPFLSNQGELKNALMHGLDTIETSEVFS